MGWATLAIGGMTLLFMMMVAIIGLLWKGGKEIGRFGQKLEDLASDSNKTAEALDRHIQWHLGNRRGLVP